MPPPAHGHGGPFAVALRNYIKSLLVKGYGFLLSCNRKTLLYVIENRTLAGKEDRNLDGEAAGRKLAVSFFQFMGEDLARPIVLDGVAMKLELLSVAEILQTLGVVVPPNPDRPSSETELLLEARFEALQVQRFQFLAEPDSPHLQTFRVIDEGCAETMFAAELSPEHRTKMVHARTLQRSGRLLENETLQGCWALSLAGLQERTAALFPAPPPAAALPGELPGPGGRGRGRGRGGGRGRGPLGAGPPAPPAGAPPEPPAKGRGRARGRGKGRG